MHSDKGQKVPAVRLLIADVRLRDALASRLTNLAGISAQVDGKLGVSDVVISTVADCPPQTARGFARSGLKVIILAPLPRASQAARYREAGAAAYVAMDLDLQALVDAVRNAAGAIRSSTPSDRGTEPEHAVAVDS